MKKLLKVLPVVLVVCVAFTTVFAIENMATQSTLLPEMIGTIGASTWILSAIFLVISIIANWKIFAKAGEPGWACLVPIYANVVQFRILGLNPWLLLLYLLPIVNFVVIAVFAIVIPFRLAKSFGKGIGWGFGLWLLPYIFNLVLAFGTSEYVGPNGSAQS